MIQWKEIEFAPDYWVSNTGRIISRRCKEEREMVLHLNETTGYKQVILTITPKGIKKPKRRTYTIHRLVALAFCDNPNGYKTVNHKNLDKTNNHYWNLEWVSQERNIHHYYNSNQKGKPRNMRAIEVWDVKGNFLGEFPSINNAAKNLGTTASTLHQILTGETKESTLFRCKYIEDVG